MTYESGLYTRSDEYGTPYIVICITTITLFYHTYIPNVSFFVQPFTSASYTLVCFNMFFKNFQFIKGFF